MAAMRMLIILLAISFNAPAAAELLDVPMQPTEEVCRAIATNNAGHVSSISRAHSECLNSPGDSGGGVCTKARCLRLHLAMNQASSAMSKINSACAERALRGRQLAQEAEDQRQENRATEHDWLERINQLDSSVSEALSINDSLEHPLRRLAEFSRQNLDELKHRIGSNIRTGNGLYSDPNSALFDELFSRTAAANRMSTSSPFRAFATQAALDSLYFQQSILIRKINDLENSIGKFDASGPNLSTPFRPSKRLPAQNSGALDCSVLRDTERSRNLSISNQSLWLSLVAKCER